MRLVTSRLVLGFAGIALVIAGCASTGGEARKAAFSPASAEAPLQASASSTQGASNMEPRRPRAGANPWSEPARTVLIAACGSCHQPGLPTSVPGALAVFDLSEDVWYARLQGQQFEGLLRRVRAMDTIDEWDKKVVEYFVDTATRPGPS